MHIEDENPTVGDIVDVMHLSGGFDPLGREDIFAVVEIFLREYVGVPGMLITKKFTQDSAKDISERLNIPLDQVVKIVTVFRLKARPKKDGKFKFMKSFLKPKVVGGGKGYIRRM